MQVRALAPGLYQKLHAACNAHIAEQVRMLRSRSSPDPVVFLGHVDDCWSNHCDAMHTIRSGRARRIKFRHVIGCLKTHRMPQETRV